MVSLSQFRARHAQDLRQRRLDALLDSASPELAIRSLRGDELYDLLRAGDLNEHADLLAHARPEQVQVVLDLALWEGDRLSARRLEDWIYLIAGMPTDTVGRWIAGLDIELVGLMIRKGARVYDLEIDGPPDEPEGTAWPTPDGLFVLDVRGYSGQASEKEQDGTESAPETSQSAEAIIQLMDRLYRADLTLARRILVGVKAELDSDLEETAYRWRQGRLQDLASRIRWSRARSSASWIPPPFTWASCAPARACARPAPTATSCPADCRPRWRRSWTACPRSQARWRA